MTDLTNSPCDLFQELVGPAMRQLVTADLALMGWAHQECDRLYRAGRSTTAIRRMIVTVEQDRRHLGPSQGGNSHFAVGLGMAVNVQIKLKMREGEKDLSVQETQEIQDWLTERYQGARVDLIGVTDDIEFWIEWNDNHSEVRI